MFILLNFLIYPSLFGLVAFWSLWQLSRLIDLPLEVRRVLFCLLGTIILAPMLSGAALITFFVPNGILLLMLLDAGIPIWEIFSYYLAFPHIAFPSLAITATVFALIAWRFVKADAKPPRHRWAAFALPVLLLVAIFQVYRYTYPDRDIPRELNNAVVEEAYGALCDDVTSLLEIADPEEQGAGIARLKAVFEADPAIVSATLYEPGQSVVGKTFSFSKERKKKQSTSCVNAVEKHRNRLSRCTRTYGKFDRLDLLGYKHPYQLGEESSLVVVYFDYDAAIDVLLK